MTRRPSLRALTLLLAAHATVARADVVALDAVADNTIYESPTGNLSNGAGQHLFAGKNDSNRSRRALLRFDLGTAVPAGSLVTAAELRLHMSRTQAGATAVAVHRLTAAWGEGTSQANGEEGGGTAPVAPDATWIHAFFSTGLWLAPGGDFAPGPSATATVGDIATYTWTSTPTLVSDVQGWLDGTLSNHGWILIGSETGVQTAKRFDSRTNATATNRPKLTVTFTPPVRGACCAAGGTCAITAPADCAAGYQGDGTVCGAGGTCGACCDTSVCQLRVAGVCGSYRGDGSSCTPDPCTAPATGACCLPSGACSEVVQAACGGSFQGNGTTCGQGGTCGACCTGSACALTVAVACSGSYRGDASACTPDPCSAPVLGACCLPSGACSEVAQAACGGSFQGNGTTCGQGGTCGACCTGSACALTVAAACSGGYRGDASACVPDPCAAPATGACCDRESCGDAMTRAECAASGGEYQGDGQSCATAPCDDESRACCFPGGTCTVMNRDLCDAQGGDRQGGSSTCASNPCAPTGACCLPASCVPDSTEDACEALGGDYQGGAACGPATCAGAEAEACCLPTGACALVDEPTCAAMGGEHHSRVTSCTPSPCTSSCSLGLIQPVTGLKAVKANLRRDVALTFTPDPNASGFNTWMVTAKSAIPDANRAGGAASVPGCLDRPTPDCLHPDAVSEAAGRLLFYNVIGACNGVEAAR